MDPATLAIGAAVGGGVGTLAAIVLWALVGRFAYKLWLDFDSLRTTALAELRSENEHLRRRLEEYELEESKRKRTERLGEESS